MGAGPNHEGPARAATVAYLARDLFFGVRLAEGLARLGLVARQLAPGDDAAPLAGCALLLVDLSLPTAHWQPLLEAARAAGMPVLAFGSHMDLERRRLALAAGAARVVANSQLVERLPDLIRRLLP